RQPRHLVAEAGDEQRLAQAVARLAEHGHALALRLEAVAHRAEAQVPRLQRGVEAADLRRDIARAGGEDHVARAPVPRTVRGFEDPVAAAFEPLDAALLHTRAVTRG